MTDALLVSSSFLPGRGGIESYLAELCESLSPRLAVLAPARRDGLGLPQDLPYPVHGYEGSMLVPHPGVLRCIQRTAARHATDRVLFGTPWPLALLGPHLTRRGLRYAVIIHGAETIAPGATPLIRARLAAALRGADVLLPVSEFTAGRVRGLLGRSSATRPSTSSTPMPPMALLRARVDVGRFAPQARTPEARASLGLGEQDRVVLCFGRLVRRKGVSRLIRALPAIAKRVPAVALVVAGTGPEEDRLRRLSTEIDARVVFAGRITEESAPALYATSDVFALPVADRWGGLEVEGLGVVLLEAAACGLPCVAGRSGGTPEAVLDGETGFVIDGHASNQIVEAVSRLLLDRELSRRMGAAGRRHVEQHFAAGTPPRALLDWLA